MNDVTQNAQEQELLNILSASEQPAADDPELLRKFGVKSQLQHPPLLRHLQRGLFQGVLKLYRRKSALSGTPLLCMYPPEKPYPVYSVDEWWSEKWDAADYQREFNFNRPFFAQFAELYTAVPKLAVYNEHAENCLYSVGTSKSKNCYYSFRVYGSRDIYYCDSVCIGGENLCDCLCCNQSSWLYDCVECVNCHNGINLAYCETCRDCSYCVDCVGCHDCLFCRNLRHKEYCIENKQYSQNEYRRCLAEVGTGDSAAWLKNRERFASVLAGAVWPETLQKNCEDCIGDGLRNCARLYQCFNCAGLTDSRYSLDSVTENGASNFFDVTGGGIGELIFNSTGNGGPCYFLRMCFKCRSSSYLTYCNDCYACAHCFGCCGLIRKSYCILNRQYSKTEYQELTERIVASMEQNGEWGQFFPNWMAPFCYNDSRAQLLVPLKKSTVLELGFCWRDEDAQLLEPSAGDAASSSHSASSVPDSSGSRTAYCSRSGKAFKIIAPEFEFYQQMKIPPPTVCPDLRMTERRNLLRPPVLFERICPVKGQKILSAISGKRPAQVWSVGAYLEHLA